MTRSMASGFKMQLGELRREVGALDAKTYGAISAAVDFSAAKGEAEMKVNAPWTDRTTAARSGLHTTTFHEIQSWTMVFAHAVNYGIWLETRRDFNGRYAIILPSIIASGNQLMRLLDGLFRKV